ncbi:CapA family protein [Akkermansiaceae bacterium]|nr:CapA family protein [Akkermansiaceae bacterium]
MKNVLKIQFLGDLSLDGLYNDPQQIHGLSSNMKWINDLDKSIDFRVVNWESQLWGNGKVNELKFPRLSTTKMAAEAILPLKVDLALLANNHVFDNWLEGFNNTSKFLEENNISSIGATTSEKDKHKSFTFTKHGIKIGVINFVGLETNPKLPKNCPIYLNIIEEKTISDEIENLRTEVDHVVVVLHWGDTEYVRCPNVKQQSLARKFIDNGASVVIGHHVHCLQGYEEYNGGLICYSLGNFLFGPQLVVPGKIDSYRTREDNMTALLAIEFTKSNFEFSWKYLRKDKNQLFLKLDNGSVKKRHLRTNKYLKDSKRELKRRYKMEQLMSPVRNYIDKNNGFLKAILSLKMKQFWLFLKILKKG